MQPREHINVPFNFGSFFQNHWLLILVTLASIGAAGAYELANNWSSGTMLSVASKPTTATVLVTPNNTERNFRDNQLIKKIFIPLENGSGTGLFEQLTEQEKENNEITGNRTPVAFKTNAGILWGVANTRPNDQGGFDYFPIYDRINANQPRNLIYRKGTEIYLLKIQIPLFPNAPKNLDGFPSQPFEVTMEKIN